LGENNAYRILVARSEEKWLLLRDKRRWEDNIKMDLREIALGIMYWIHLADDRDQWEALVNTVMNIRVK
jgi:hypothetical protein